MTPPLYVHYITSYIFGKLKVRGLSGTDRKTVAGGQLSAIGRQSEIRAVPCLARVDGVSEGLFLARQHGLETLSVEALRLLAARDAAV